jgi:hypothetical protein
VVIYNERIVRESCLCRKCSARQLDEAMPHSLVWQNLCNRTPLFSSRQHKSKAGLMIFSSPQTLEIDVLCVMLIRRAMVPTRAAKTDIKAEDGINLYCLYIYAYICLLNI